MFGARVAAALRALRQLGPVGPAMALATALPIAGVALLTAPLLRLAPALQDSGVAGAALFAVGAGALAGLSLIPMHLLAVLAGWTFALVPGLPVVFAGLVAAAALGYVLSAFLAGRRVVDLIGEHLPCHGRHQAVRQAVAQPDRAAEGAPSEPRATARKAGEPSQRRRSAPHRPVTRVSYGRAQGICPFAGLRLVGNEHS